MNPLSTRFLLSMALCLFPLGAAAEIYVGGQIGLTVPQGFSSVEGSGPASGVKGSDLELQNSVMYGAKAGYFLQNLRWLGAEVEVFNTTPHFKQQVFTATGPGGTGSVELPGAYLRVLTTAFNIITRYPGEKFQPYIGVGVGIFIVNAHDAEGSSSDTAPGLNALAGIRYFLTDHLAVFGEHKYNRADLGFDTGVNGIGLLFTSLLSCPTSQRGFEAVGGRRGSRLGIEKVVKKVRHGAIRLPINKVACSVRHGDTILIA